MSLSDRDLLDRMNSRVPPTGKLLGFGLIELDSEAGFVRIAYEAKPEFCNAMGNVQGGFVAAMLDDAAVTAGIVKAQRRIAFPTLEFKTSFFAAAKVGPLFAEGRCLRLGKRTAFLEADLFDPEGLHLARMSTTVMPMELEARPNLVENG